MTPSATGRRETRDGHDSVVFDRVFHAPIESVWAAVTESDRLGPLGRHLDRRPGHRIGPLPHERGGRRHPARDLHDPRVRPTPPALPDLAGRRRAARLPLPARAQENPGTAGTTTLTFSQSVPDAEMATGVGPGWE